MILCSMGFMFWECISLLLGKQCSVTRDTQSWSKWQKQPLLCDTRPGTPCWVMNDMVLWVTGTSLLILLATLMKSSAWRSAAFSVNSESILITNVPTNHSRLDDQRHSLFILWKLFSSLKRIIAETLTWKVSVYVCAIRRGEYVVHHTVISMQQLFLLLTVGHFTHHWCTTYRVTKLTDTGSSAPAQERQRVISESVGKHLLYRNTAGERYGHVAEGLFLQFLPVCAGNLNEDFQNQMYVTFQNQ